MTLGQFRSLTQGLIDDIEILQRDSVLGYLETYTNGTIDFFKKSKKEGEYIPTYVGDKGSIPAIIIY